MRMNPVVHFELPAENRKRMSDFYTKAFGWNTIQLGAEMGNYVVAHTSETDSNGMVKNPGMINGGFYQKTSEMPAMHPSFIIAVDDINEHIEIVKKSGGKIIGTPSEIPGVGMYVRFEDTEGNSLSMLQSIME